MDQRTLRTLKRLNLHLKVQKILLILSYFLIISGVLTYIFFAINRKDEKYKLVSGYKKDQKKYKTEKIMINPKIRFKHTDSKIYDIEAKRASHINEEEITMFDAVAKGDIGNITSGQLKVYENGDHLVFTVNPVLILNNNQNNKK